MNWKPKLRVNGKPTLYEGWHNNQERFCISTIGSAIYLQDLSESKVGIALQSYSFDTVDNAKIAASNLVKNSTPLCSNSKDPFGGLSDIIQGTQRFLDGLKVK